MKRTPVYGDIALAALDELEASGSVALINAVCDAIDLICDHGDTAEAHREQLGSSSGFKAWKVAVHTRSDDWAVLWWPKGREALIFYIGPL